MKIKTNLITGIILTGFIVFLFVTCQKEKLGVTGFPRIKTLEVEMVSDTGAVFKGEIMDIPNGIEVLDYGFVWSSAENSISSLEKISLGKPAGTGSFLANINRSLAEGKTYYFKSYIQTSETMIYGNELEFVSLGSKAPVITSVSPSNGGWNDTITINGQYFSTVKSNLTLLFNSLQGSIISTTDSQIKVRVPADLDEITTKLSVKFANKIYPSNVNFTLVPNLMVQKLEPETAKWNDIIKIKGKNLRSADSVFFNNIPSSIRTINDTTLTVAVPSKLDTASANITVKVNSFKFVCPTKFNLSQGKIVSFSPSTGTFGTSIKINARNVRISNCKVLIGTNYATITYQHDSTLIVSTPYLNQPGDYTITIMDGSFTVVSQSKFTYTSSGITGIAPTNAEQGYNIRLTGTDFIWFPNSYVSTERTIKPNLFQYHHSIWADGKAIHQWRPLSLEPLSAIPMDSGKSTTLAYKIPRVLIGIFSMIIENKVHSKSKENLIPYSQPLANIFTSTDNDQQPALAFDIEFDPAQI